MRKRIGIVVAFALALALVTQPRAQVLNPLMRATFVASGGDCAAIPCSAASATKQLCRNSTTDTVLYVCDTSTNLFVAAASFAGGSSTTYMVADADTGCIQVWVDGGLDWQFCPDHVIPPPCPADIYAKPIGSMCVDVTTGEMVIRALRVRIVP